MASRLLPELAAGARISSLVSGLYGLGLLALGFVLSVLPGGQFEEVVGLPRLGFGVTGVGALVLAAAGAKGRAGSGWW